MPETYDFAPRGHDAIVQEIANYLAANGHKVELVTDMNLQKRGIDLRIWEPTLRRWLAFDVKADMRMADTGNISFELLSNFEEGTPGAGVKPDTYGWLYMDVQSRRVYVIPLKELRKALVNHEYTGKPKFTGTTGRNGAALYHTLHTLIPLEWIKRHVKIKEWVLPTLQKQLFEDKRDTS